MPNFRNEVVMSDERVAQNASKSRPNSGMYWSSLQPRDRRLEMTRDICNLFSNTPAQLRRGEVSAAAFQIGFTDKFPRKQASFQKEELLCRKKVLDCHWFDNTVATYIRNGNVEQSVDF